LTGVGGSASARLRRPLVCSALETVIEEDNAVTASFPRRRARIVAGSVLVAGLLAVSACSAGQDTQTSHQVAAVPGANASAGPAGGDISVALRDLTVVYKDPKGYPAGADAPLAVRLFSQGGQAVSLIGASSDAAQAVVLAGGGTAPTVGATEEVATASPGASPAAAAQPPAGESTFEVKIPAAGYTLLVPGSGPHLVLNKLKMPLVPGDSVNVTFTFSDGATVTVPVPVGVPTAPAERSPMDITEHE
jgi:copper(I)-binding protein